MRKLYHDYRFLWYYCFSVLSLAAESEVPNILIIMVDDLGWNHHSVRSASLDTAHPDFMTPNLERLAAGGLSFTHAYAQPNCAPARAAILTGQYPARVHNDVYVVGNLNRNNRRGISASEAGFIGPEQSEDVAPKAITLAETLKNNGYTTAHIGKYHVGGHEGGESTLPQKAGFDINLGGGKQGHQATCFAEMNNGQWAFPGVAYGDLDPFAKPYDERYVEQYGLESSMVGKPKHICDAMADALEQTIENCAYKGKPFYIQFHTYAVHGPVKARPDLKAAAFARLGKDQAKVKRAEYLGFIAGFDEAVGRALKRLDDPNGDGNPQDSLLANTLVVFISDNGGIHASNAPLRGNKGTFYEGGIRIPMIASWPGRIPAGQVTDRRVHVIDFYPTFLELAGASWQPDPAAHPLDGESFAEVLKKPTGAAQRGPLFYLFPGYLDTRATPLVAVIDKRGDKYYKLIYFWEGNRCELFCLSDDPGESNNLAASKPELVSELGNMMVSWLGQQHPTWKPKLPIDKKTAQPAAPPEF